MVAEYPAIPGLSLFPRPRETIWGTLDDLSSGRRTCVGVVEHCLARIDECEPHVRAWVSIDRAGALQAARVCDTEIQSGSRPGPLHGIPLGIKDIVDVAGLPTAAGSQLLARGRPADRDADVVARLRQAGAIILGKTVTTQFACFDPPVTRNPWNTARTPGGSSSGSAAAVAAGMCLGAIGSQTGGSITRPASFCGVAGCKPTWGLVSVEGVYPLAPSMDHVGPLARDVRDLALLLDVIGDRPHASSGREQQSHSSGQAPRIGRLAGLFERESSSAARSAVERALARCAAAGATLQDAALPAIFESVTRQHRTVMAAEIAAWHGERFREFPADYLPSIRGIIEEGLAIPAVTYIRSREHQARLRQELQPLFDGADVLACPSTVDGAPEVSSTGSPVLNAPFSYTGLPTVTLPIGLTADGLPLGLQLVGKPFDERALLQTAGWCEQAIWSQTAEHRESAGGH